MNVSQSFLTPIMSRRQRLTFGVLMVAWIAALVFFWSWWLQSDHVVTPFGMVVNSVMFVWTLFLPGVFFFHLARMKRSNPALELPRLRVAMVVTKAPSEPWEVVRRTLRAMLRQDMPFHYDVWLADEAPDRAVRQWCEANHVHISSREGRPDYHRSEWPRRTRSKEGNLAFFYDTWGYRDYDIVAQFDADHRPSPTYLREVVRPFADPTVGYVAAPSICDVNASACWAARGRLYKEAVFHGPQQAGGHHAIPPVCIGSHYAVRTQALEQIGGVGPELAEDFSTSLMMNSFGWSGVFALDAEAHGDGPETFADFVTQEFQWARSLSNVMLLYNRFFWRGLSRRAKIKLGFGEVWYPLYAIQMLVASLFPIIALATRTPWASVRLVDFWEHIFVVSLVLLLILAWVADQGWLRPRDAPLLSWETALFLFTRWPWVLWGVIQSWAGWILHRRLGFKITPKGIDDAPPIGLSVVVPYLLISGACATTAIIQAHPGRAVGYYYFCLVNALIYLAVTTMVVALHLHENQSLTPRGAWRLARGPLLALIVLGSLVVAAFALRAPVAAHVLVSPTLRTSVARPFLNLPPSFAPAPPHLTSRWLVLLSGLALALGAVLFAVRSKDVRTRAGRVVNVLLLSLVAISSSAYLVFTVEWRHGHAISDTGFLAVLGAGLLVGAAAVIRRDSYRWHAPAESLLLAAAEADPDITHQPMASPRELLPAQIEARAARHASEPYEAEIASDPRDADTFTLVPVNRNVRERLPALASAGSTSEPPSPRTPEISRAHALLYDLLIIQGWEPCGRGAAWYSHRFRQRLPRDDEEMA